MKRTIVDQYSKQLIKTRPGCGLHMAPAAPFPVTAERLCVRTAGQLTAIWGPRGRSGISGCVDWEPTGSWHKLFEARKGNANGWRSWENLGKFTTVEGVKWFWSKMIIPLVPYTLRETGEMISFVGDANSSNVSSAPLANVKLGLDAS